jgi:diguanylate cyclase (GGDEF)-like protein
MLAAQFALMTDFVPVASTGWLGLVRFVGLFYALGVAFFLNMMLTGRGENRYRAAALTDPLTGLANRRAFMEQGQRILDRQGQDGKPAALLLFDLDRFKRINDSFGHATGDRVLHVFADVLSETLRPVDLVARIGGEEFVAVVPGVDAEAAVAIANRTRDTLEKMALLVDGRRVGATVSVGVAASAGRQRTVIDMLAEADQALYRAKDGGRNRVVLADATGRPETAKIVHVA